MKRIRNLVLTTVTILFMGMSVVPAAAATPSYATQYSWSGAKYSNSNSQTGNSYNNVSKANYNYSNYNYTSYYGYKPAQTTTVAKQKATTTTAASKTTTTTTKPASATSTTAKEQQMVNLVNQERTSRGIAALTVDAQLVKVARMKSQDMINNNYFGHQSPKYGSPFDLMKSQGITYRYAGENLAGADTVQRAHTNLMNSAGHRANILNPNFTKIGVGVVQGGPYGLMISQEFTG